MTSLSPDRIRRANGWHPIPGRSGPEASAEMSVSKRSAGVPPTGKQEISVYSLLGISHSQEAHQIDLAVPAH